MTYTFKKVISASIVLEWDNAQELLDHDSACFIERLTTILEKNIKNNVIGSSELFIVYDPQKIALTTLKGLLDPLLASAQTYLSVVYLAAPGTSYYEKKAVPAFLTKADIMVMADSDCVYHENWLEQIVEPFADPSVAVVYGETFAKRGSFFRKCKCDLLVFSYRK
ncbi:MAG: glycosyltransferase [Alphaproteobacteria bacterium]|nr:glycosyltransferase [Alphaproteobacteria bacterium]